VLVIITLIIMYIVNIFYLFVEFCFLKYLNLCFVDYDVILPITDHIVGGEIAGISRVFCGALLPVCSFRWIRKCSIFNCNNYL